MSTAVKVQQKTQEPLKIEVSHTRSGNEDYEILPAVLPPKSTAVQFLQVFFHQCNSQIPLFHREEFLRDYFIPIYGKFDESISLASNSTTINTSFFNIYIPMDNNVGLIHTRMRFKINYQEKKKEMMILLRLIYTNCRKE